MAKRFHVSGAPRALPIIEEESSEKRAANRQRIAASAPTQRGRCAKCTKKTKCGRCLRKQWKRDGKKLVSSQPQLKGRGAQGNPWASRKRTLDSFDPRKGTATGVGRYDG
jgi:hypothetical protein